MSPSLRQRVGANNNSNPSPAVSSLKETPNSSSDGKHPKREEEKDERLFDNTPFWHSLQIFGTVNGLGLVISLTTGSHLHLDLLGVGAFGVAAILPVPTASISGWAIAVWSTRLASFLFYRACIVQHEGRLETTLSTASGTVFFWVASTVWGVVTALPHSLGLTRQRRRRHHAHCTNGTTWSKVAQGLGLLLVSAGWFIEAVADWQKWSFKMSSSQQEPVSSFCNEGLWQWSQHPNWIGDMVFWWGILVLNLPALFVQDPNVVLLQQWRAAVALLSPLFLWTLFYGQATGSITDALAMANARYGYGTDPAYTHYVDSTPLLFPNLFRGR